MLGFQWVFYELFRNIRNGDEVLGQTAVEYTIYIKSESSIYLCICLRQRMLRGVPPRFSIRFFRFTSSGDRQRTKVTSFSIGLPL